MDFNTFLPRCKSIVSAHMNKEEDGKYIIAEDVFVVWYSKTLQNAKAILGVPGSDKMFELTYNGSKNELYMDEYVKITNQMVKI